MGENSKSLRIDWFDGTVTHVSNTSSRFYDEEAQSDTKPDAKPSIQIKKAIGFKRLHDLSLLQPIELKLELSTRPGFWLLFEGDLKGDFIVLLVKILCTVYKSLDPNENSKIVSLLRKDFEKSDFIPKLKQYIMDIPKVKNVDKRMNAQLWDDVEGFYLVVVQFCMSYFDYNFKSENYEYFQQLHDLLDVVEISAIGVQEEHMEPIGLEMYKNLHLVKSQLKPSKGSPTPVKPAPRNTETSPLVNFRDLQIFPTKEDVLGKDSVITIPHNIIDGAYMNVDHYLDLQFKLLREDCYGPLREGIANYMKNPSKQRYENIRIFPKVRLIRAYISRNKVGHLVDIAWNERNNRKSVNFTKYAYNKWLMCGSLCLFTSDNFKNILCASVLDSSPTLLKEGYIAVTFENPLSSNIFSEEYMMVESEVFFEPYHRVLKVLQTLGPRLPMEQYIVYVQKRTLPPAYLTQKTKYSIRIKNSEETSFNVLSDSWPSKYFFGLDDSQMEACKVALTNELAIIQGPPGTGKTFMGIKIASILLRNLSLVGTPILVVCYTNHALDQFLEGILDVTEAIVRLGSQSKSKILEPYNLYNKRLKEKSKYGKTYAAKRACLGSIHKDMTNLQSDIEKCENELISYRTIKPYMPVEMANRIKILEACEEDAILKWLYLGLLQPLESAGNYDSWENRFDNYSVTDKIESCFSEKWASKEIESMQTNIKYIKEIDDKSFESNVTVRKLQKETEKIQRKLNIFKKYMARDKNINVIIPSGLSTLDADQRWHLYFKAAEALKESLMVKMNKLLVKHKACSAELEEISSLMDAQLLQTVRVVGMTTTAAARRHELCVKLQSPIVIVEEAAEVLETHIVASLTEKCKHLILIGDHKQLRPSSAYYKLAKHHNIEVSLFERLVRNNVYSRTLTTQRRMRENFVKLLVPVIYDRLDSHPDVLKYPPIKGMRDTLFFFDHNVFEDSENLDNWSHQNSFEAQWCVSLANFLRRMEYKADDIIILATYNAQATLITKISKKYPLLDDVKITVVDNYQGEESRIVILSLVRSNKDGNIGFLSAANRICVALSRAKEGFYMFGNMGILQASRIWKSIHEQLKIQNAIGEELILKCDNGENLIIKTAEELDIVTLESLKSPETYTTIFTNMFNSIFTNMFK